MFHLHESLGLCEEVAQQQSVVEAVSQISVVGLDGGNEVARNEACALVKIHI